MYPIRVINCTDGGVRFRSDRWGHAVSIGKRFIDLARAELNSLLDYAARRGPDDDDTGTADADGLAGFSRKELEEELARRRSAYAEVEEAIHGRRGAGASSPSSSPESAAPPRSSDRPPSSGTRSSRPGPIPSHPGAGGLGVERAYAMLEVPVGSSFEAVRTSYRNLMRKYHPDRHTSSPPDQQRAANEVAQRLTEAYKLLQKRLEP
jgi:DnaJ-domain-containing protein 1